jgi:transcriptional regulator with XRE-family HTH domain
MVAARIRAAREHRGLSRTQLAFHVNKCEDSVARYEHGERIPPVGTLARIADVLDVSVAYLLGDEAEVLAS